MSEIHLTVEEVIAIIETHKAHWQRLLREKICDETEGRETIESFDRAISALKEEKPKGMTNGDVIQAVFPYVKTEDILQGSTVILTNLDKGHVPFLKKWWNAPYQKESE